MEGSGEKQYAPKRESGHEEINDGQYQDILNAMNKPPKQTKKDKPREEEEQDNEEHEEKKETKKQAKPKEAPKKEKSKDDKEAAKDTTLLKNSDGEFEYTLKGGKKLKVRVYKSQVYVDIREYWSNDGKLLPTKKGVSLSIANWNELKELMPSIDNCIGKMK